MTKLNAFAKRLIVLFGVQKALHSALLRMQANQDDAFYTSEDWIVERNWIETEFFAEVLGDMHPSNG